MQFYSGVARIWCEGGGVNLSLIERKGLRVVAHKISIHVQYAKNL